MKGRRKHIYSVNPRMLPISAPTQTFLFLTFTRHLEVDCCCCYFTCKSEKPAPQRTGQDSRHDTSPDSWFRWDGCFSPCTVKVVECCQQQFKLERSELSVGKVCESLSLIAPDTLARSSMTQLLNTAHLAGISWGPAADKQLPATEE